MPDPMQTPGGNLVVFEGETRGEWKRDVSGWRFDGIWPTRDQRRELAAALAQGRGLLVVMPPTDALITILRSEAGQIEGDIDEVLVDTLDWMPAPARAWGLRFRADTLRATAATPALLRTPVTVSPEYRGIRFAVRTGRVGDRGLVFADLADHLFGGAAAADGPATVRLRRWPFTVRRRAA